MPKKQTVNKKQAAKLSNNKLKNKKIVEDVKTVNKPATKPVRKKRKSKKTKY